MHARSLIVRRPGPLLVARGLLASSALLAAPVLLLSPAPPAAAADRGAPRASLCGLCHPDVRVQFEQSVHAREDIDCAACHGGNPSASSVEGAHRGSFRGSLRRRDIPALCAGCHGDIRLMRPYNLPSDQYALYQTSQHGLRLAKGDEKVAVCTDCHGMHEIRRRDDPQSGVFERNIPRTCGRCHGAGAGGGPPKPGSPYAEYAAGIHGQAFLGQGSAAAPTCASCHGAHGAAPPGVGDVDKVCGQCHATARSYYREGPHARALREGTGPECAHCHGHHRIERADVTLLRTVCVTCHDAGSDPVRTAAAMETLFTGATEEIEKAGVLLGRAAAIPLYVEDYRARLEEAHTSLVQASPVVHAVDAGRVEELTQRARGIAREVESEIEGKLEQRKWRRVGLLLFWFYLILTLSVLVLYRRRAAGAPPAGESGRHEDRVVSPPP
jgi:predicted CXXCH cytochrome family protein